MPFLTNETGLERLRDACAAQGLQLDIGAVWWRHGGALDKAWQDMGWGDYDPLKRVGAFDVGGGCVGWFRQLDMNGRRVWCLECVSPAGLADWPAGTLITPDKLRIGLRHAINQYHFPKQTRKNAPHKAVAAGARVAAVTRDGRGIIGLADTVDAEGMVLTVRLAPEAAPEVAAEYSRSWFAVLDVNDKFDKLWRDGPREWGNYYAMRAALRRPKDKQEPGRSRKAKAARAAEARGAMGADMPWRNLPSGELAELETAARSHVAVWIRSGQVAEVDRESAFIHACKWVYEQRKAKL